MEKSNMPPMAACRHLGTAEDPFQQRDLPADEHRCYLWMQRDRIDLDHQKGYCLSGRYRHCPWLQISLPCQPGVKRVWQEAVVCTVSEAGHRFWPVACRIAREAGAAAAAHARAAALWAWHGLSGALDKGWEGLPHVAGSLGRCMLNGASSLGKGGLKGASSLGKGVLNGAARGARSIWVMGVNHRRGNSGAVSVPMPAETEDFAMLMRLGREASRAGHRKQAHLCFSRAAALSSSSEDAWLWLAATAEGNEESLAYLEKALAINPTSGRARTQLEEIKQPEAPRTVLGQHPVRADAGAPALLKKGIAALDAENEDEAYQLFTAATQADKSNEAAWFWRAKTATDLNEVITCLQRVLELNPGNEKARASLTWAVDRQHSASNRVRPVTPSEPQPVMPGLYSSMTPDPRPFLMQMASTAFMLLGVLWVGPVVLPALDGPIASLYHRIVIFPILEMPHVSSSALVNDPGFPEFNVLYLIPLSVAVLYFVAMEAIWSRRRGISLYITLVAAISILTVGAFGSGQAPTIPLTVITAIAGISALAGRITYHRQTRARLTARAKPAV